ncbi:MAG: hypothetical protein KDA60_19510, partial [Planctomycetales bacterium]|nr:hypothetical protein [Planctomycetales bacterium]
PLLAPAHSRAINERPRELRGRLFTNYMHTWNREQGDDHYSLGRVGSALWMDNPFGQGGKLQLNGELNRRGIFLDDQQDQLRGPGRLDRISYQSKDVEGVPIRYELGRFLCDEFAEFGVIDGGDIVYRTQSGHRFGAAMGFLPEPFPNLQLSDDFSFATYYRFTGQQGSPLTTGLGYQKTWHKGTPDRDLLIYNIGYDPFPRFSVHGSLWTDFYDGRDTHKTRDVEITQAILHAIYRTKGGSGVGAHTSYVRWPQLLRQEFLPFVDEQIVRGEVRRYGLFAYHPLNDRTRLDARVDQWQDQSGNEGTSYEGQTTFRDFMMPQLQLTLAAYGNHGVYSSGPGGRFMLFSYRDWGATSIGYDIANYKLLQEGDRYFQHAVHSNLDLRIGSRQTLTLTTDYRFGERQDALQFGMFLQRRL